MWSTGGGGALPRIDSMANQMKQWAERNDAETAVLFAVSDFDPTGVIISESVADEVPVTAPDVTVVRLGMNPALADDHDAPQGAYGKTDTSHAKSEARKAACEEYDVDLDTSFQAEALDYSTWADIIGSEVETVRGQPSRSRPAQEGRLWPLLVLRRPPPMTGSIGGCGVRLLPPQPVKRGARVQNALGGTPRHGSIIVRRPRGRGGITTRVVRG